MNVGRSLLWCIYTFIVIQIIQQNIVNIDCMQKHKITLFLCYLGCYSFAQTWTQAIQIGGENKEAITVMTGSEEHDLYVGGIYDGDFDWDGLSVSSEGQDDLFLGRLDKHNLTWRWKITSGSEFDDAWSDLKIAPDGNLVCAGVFWVEMDLGGIKLKNQIGGKSIFLAKITPLGEVLWGRSFDGTALKEVRGIDIDERGNIFLTGYFRDQLLLDDIILEAVGETDAFVVKLNSDGLPQWARSFGGRNDTRGIEIGLMANNHLALVGYYNDTTYFDAFSLPAKTFDRDLFVAQLDSTGQVLWARRAGGVFDEEPFDLVVDQENNIWITGYVVGVLTVAEDFSTQSTNATSDLLLLRYQPDGTPTLATTFGGIESVQANDLQLVQGQVLLTGTYQGEVNFTPNFPAAMGDETGFVFALNPSGQALWAQNIPGGGQVFSNQLLRVGNTIFVSGTFRESLDVGDQVINSRGGFDGFLAVLTLPPTTTNSPSNDSAIKLYPNPVSDTLYLETNQEISHLRLENADQKIMFSSKNAVDQIDVGHLAVGVYFLHYQLNGFSQTRVVLIQR